MKYLIPTLLFLLTNLAFSQDKKETTIAILNFENRGISQNEALILTDRFRSELSNTKAFIIVERGKMENILEEIGFQLTACTSSECLVEVGKLLNVTQMIGGSVGKFGTVYTIDLRMIDVETGQILYTISEDHKGRLDDLLKIIKNISYQMASLSKKTDKEEKKLGKLKISSVPPGAIISINNMEIGSTPRNIESLDVGKYSVQLKKDGYADYDTSIYIFEKGINQLAVKLHSNYSKLSVSSNPKNSVVLINGKRVGKTPFSKVLKNGAYDVEVKKNNFKPWRQNLKLFANKDIDIKLESVFAQLKIDTEPSNANVYLNNKLVGKTPFHKSIRKGKYSLKLTKKNHNDWKSTIDFSKDQNITAKLDFSEAYIANLKKENNTVNVSKKSSNVWLWTTTAAVILGGTAYLFLANDNNNQSKSDTVLPGVPSRP